MQFYGYGVNSYHTHVVADITDLENNFADVSWDEVEQIKTIGNITISNSQWGYLGDLDQQVRKAADVEFQSVDVGTGEIIAGSLNRETGVLTLEIAGIPIASVAAASFTLAQDLVLATGRTIEPLMGDTKEPTGFVYSDNTESTLALDTGTREFTIDKVASNFNFYHCGKKFVKTTAESVFITDVEGLHYVYYNSSGVLTDTTTFPGMDECLVAFIQWDATNKDGIVLNERHRFQNPDIHTRDHFAFGALHKEGFGISGYTLDSDTDADVTFGLDSGSFYDEDILHEHAAQADPAQIPVMYLDGAGANVRWDAKTDYAFKNTAASRVNYNELTGGAWQQTEATDNYYVAYFVCAWTNDGDHKTISIQGQREDSKLADALLNNKFGELALGDFGPELRPLYRLIIRTKNTFGGTRKAKILHVADIRSINVPAGAAATQASHARLHALDDTVDHSLGGLIADKMVAVDTASLVTTSIPRVPTRGSVIIGSSTPAWVELGIGAADEVLKSDGTDVAWGAGGGDHELLSATHTDSVAAGVSRGSLVVGTATPKWEELVVGSAGDYLRTDGTDSYWSALLAGDLPAHAHDGETMEFDAVTSDGGAFSFTTSGLVTFSQSVASAGDFIASLGAVGTPSHTFTGDLNTGMWSSGANILNFSTAGVERMEINALGNVSIGAAPINGRLYLYNATVETTTHYYGLRNLHYKTAGVTTEADDIYGFYNILRLDHNGSTVGHLRACYNMAEVVDGTVGDGAETVQAGWFYARMSGGIAGGAVTGSLIRADCNTGTVTTAVYGADIGFDIEATMTSVGGDAIALRLYGGDDLGVDGTTYMIYLDEDAGIDYGFYQDGTAKSQFNGAVGFGGNAVTGGAVVVYGSIKLDDLASAPATTLNMGQIWVKDLSPTKLFFTDDAGDDHEIAFV